MNAKFALNIGRMTTDGGKNDEYYLSMVKRFLLTWEKYSSIEEFHKNKFKREWDDSRYTEKDKQDIHFRINRRSDILRFIESNYHNIFIVNFDEDFICDPYLDITVDRNSMYYGFFFAYRLKQLSVQQILPFLDYHMSSSFNNDHSAYSDFILGVLAEYNNDLLFEKHTTMINRWLEKPAPKKKTERKNKSPQRKKLSSEKKIDEEKRLGEINNFRDLHFDGPNDYDIFNMALEKLDMVETDDNQLLPKAGYEKSLYTALSDGMNEQELWSYSGTEGVKIILELLMDYSESIPKRTTRDYKRSKKIVDQVLSELIADFR